MENNYIHPLYKTKKVLQFVADLINDYDYKTYDDLSFGDKEGFTALLIEAAGNDANYEWLVENNNKDYLIALFCNALRLDNEKNNTLFLDKTKIYAIEYYERIMRLLFIYVQEDILCARREWLDYESKNGDPDEAYDKYREGIL